MTDPSGFDVRRRFEAIAVPLLRPLHGAAWRMTRDSEAARDAVQEALLRAFRTFGNFQEGTNAKAWLFTILHTVLRNRRRREEVERREFAAGTEDTRFDETLAAAPQPFPWSGAEIQEALGRLPVEYREALLLVDVEELTYEEAASVADCPVGTLRSRLHRGRRALYVALEDHARRMGLLKRSEP